MKISFPELIANASPDTVVITTPEGEIVHWSKAAEAAFGYSSDEVMGRSVLDMVVPGDDVAAETRNFAETLNSGAATFEGWRRRKDGSLIFMAISNRLILADDGSRLVLSSKKDVTALKNRRIARLMESRFLDLIESMPDGIVMVDPTGHIVISNSHAERLFGYAPKELCNKPVEVLLPARYRESHVGFRSKYFSQSRARAMGAGLELFGLRRDGSEFPVEISLSPLVTEESTLVCSAIRDISDRRKIQEELRQKNIELAQANEAKDRFLASMSHELRTPMNAIIGFTGTLLMKLPGPLNEDQEKQLRTVQSSAHHLLSLINDLLDVAKIGAGKVDLNRERIVCQELLEDVVRSLHGMADSKHLRFDLALPSKSVNVHSDRRSLSQIVLNLANNAIKFTEQGSVCIELVPPERAGAGTIEIRVSDTGIGILPEDQARLFNAFSQVGGAGSAKREGSGLGLHLSQRLAELLGGTIRCESAVGKGSRFTLSLPAE